MTPQQSKRRPSRPPARRPAGQGPGTVDKTRVLILRLVRTVLLTIIGFTAVNLAVVLLRPGNVDRLVADVAKKGPHSASLTTFAQLSLVFAVVCAVLMFLLGLNASFLRDRLFRRNVSGLLYVLAFAAGVAAIGLGFAGAKDFGIQIVVGLLPAIVCFVVISALAPGFLGGRGATVTAGGQGTARGSAGDATDPPPAPRQKSRQRRGGRR